MSIILLIMVGNEIERIILSVKLAEGIAQSAQLIEKSKWADKHVDALLKGSSYKEEEISSAYDFVARHIEDRVMKKLEPLNIHARRLVNPAMNELEGYYKELGEATVIICSEKYDLDKQSKEVINRFDFLVFGSETKTARLVEKRAKEELELLFSGYAARIEN